MSKKPAPKDKPTQAIIMSGNMAIGYKFIGPLTTGQAMDFLNEMKQKQNPDIAHAELVYIPLFSPDEARKEIEEEGNLMAPVWLSSIPRRTSNVDIVKLVKREEERLEKIKKEGKSTKSKII